MRGGKLKVTLSQDSGSVGSSQPREIVVLLTLVTRGNGRSPAILKSGERHSIAVVGGNSGVRVYTRVGVAYILEAVTRGSVPTEQRRSH